MDRPPAAYFITFHTYGTRLHGHPDGSVDDEHNEFLTEPLPSMPHLERYERARANWTAMTLDTRCRAVIDGTIREVIEYRGWSLHTMNVRTTHVHVVVAAPCDPERVMNDFKAYCTRRLAEAGLIQRGEAVWARHGSTKYLWDREAVSRACFYVDRMQGPDLPRA